MFCQNCGKELPENAAFCPECGTQIVAPEAAPEVEETAPVAETPVVEAAPEVEAPAIETAPAEETAPVVEAAPVVEEAPKKAKKSKKGLIIAIIAIVLALAIGAVSLFFIFSKPYEKEVENYLNFFAEQSDDVPAFLSTAYMGGSFGEVANTSDSAELHSAVYEAVFEEESMDYGDLKNKDWEDIIHDQVIESFYDRFDSVYGDWELEYEILESKKLSDSKTKKLQKIVDNMVESYEEILDEADLSSKNEDLLEEFIDELDEDISKAYTVEVEIKINGEKKDFEDTFEFKVAKVGGEWIILEGPEIYDLIVYELEANDDFFNDEATITY